jgi:excinuclease UvrABC nuclease subunit
MAREPTTIRELFRQLLRAPRTAFPKPRERLAVPDSHGVYIIFSPRGTVLHVGRTVRGESGLRRRLNNHLHGGSSFTRQFLRGKGSKLRGTHTFAFLEVANARRRALLEAFASGSLCPKYLGVGENAA